MSVEVVMPKFGLTMQAGTIQRWFKAEGETIEAGQPLYEVETEKVLYEVEAPAAGVVAKLLYPPEATVACAEVVAVIAVEGEDPAAVAARYGAGALRQAQGERPIAVKSGRGSAHAEPVEALGREVSPPATIIATPAARTLARARGIDLPAVRGSGPGGRITREDVEARLTAPRVPEAIAVHPLRGVRKTIAERMWKSLQSTAQLTITTEADVTPLAARRRRLQAEFPVTYTDLIVEAVAAALRAHPRLRVTVDGDAVQQHDEIHIGIAVALDEGLIVPVLRNADRMPLRQLAERARILADDARGGRLGVDDVSGGVFTITNLGMYDIDAFTPILHQPQVAILGIGRIVEKPAVFEGQVAIRSLMTLSLTFDHRIVDGAPAAAFLRDVARRLGEASGAVA